MSIESLRTQIETFRARTNGENGKDDHVTSEDYQTLIVSLNEIAVAAAQELTKARAEIEAERQSYQNLFRFAEEGHFVTDRSGIIHEANQVSGLLLGVSETDLIGKDLSSFIRIQDQPAFRSNKAELNELKNFHKWETVFVRSPNQEFKASVTVSIIRDYLGNASGLRWLVRDISQHQEIEEKLRRKTGQLSEAQKIGRVGSWEWDIQKNELLWSDEMYRLYGLEPQSVRLTFESFLASVHPQDQARVRTIVEDSFKTHQPFSFDHRILQPDGTLRHLHAHGLLLLDDHGQPRRMAGTGQDITEQLQADEQLRRLNSELEQRVEARTQELRDANERLKNIVVERAHNQESIHQLNRELNRRINELQTVLNVLPVGVTVAHDPAANSININSTGQGLLGIKQDENSSLPVRPFKVMHNNEDIPLEDRPLRHSMINNVVIRDAELEVVRDDGTILNLLTYASPLYDELGQVRGGVAAYIDITERKAVDRRLSLQYAVWRALSESNELSEAALKIVQLISEKMGWEFGAFWIYDSNANKLYLEKTWQKPELLGVELMEASRSFSPSAGEGLLGSVYLTHKPLWLSDFTAETNFVRKAAALKNGFNSLISFPLHSSENQVLGVMEFFSHFIQQPTPDLMQLFDALAQQIGEYIQRKQNEKLLETRMRQQDIITHLSNRALLSVNLEELFNEVCVYIGEALSVEFSDVLEVTPEKQGVLFRAGTGWGDDRKRTHFEIQPGSQAHYVLSENKPIRMVELDQESRFQPDPVLVQYNIVSGMSAVISGRSQPFGLLEAYSSARREFTHDDLHFLQRVAHVVAAAIQHREVEDALRVSRNQVSVILEGITDGITAQTRTGELIYVNDAAARLTGYENAHEMMTTPLNQITSKFKIFDESGMPMSPDQLPGRAAMRGEVPPPLTIRFKVVETGEERWSLVKAQPVTNAAGEVMMVVNIFHDISELKRAELRQRLLAETSKVMAKELDYATRLNELAYLLVPSLADWCAIDLLDNDNILQRVAVAHPNPQMVEWAHELHERYPPDPNSNTGAYKVVRSNQSEYVPMITEQMIEMVPSPDQRDLLRKLKIASAIVVPLFARGHSLGTLSLVWAESDHYYTPDDLELTEELGRRAALALDNARLYSEAQSLNIELEDRVIKRTSQLQRTNLRLTREIDDRKLAEEKYRQLNAELEERVGERTSQLENANQSLQREILERELADDALRLALQKTSEVYEISRAIGLVNTPDELLQALLSSSHLVSVIRASIAIFSRIWEKDQSAPESCIILTAWNKQPETLLYIGRDMTLAEYGVIEPLSWHEPLVIANIQSDARVSDVMRVRLTAVGAVGSILLPLIAGGDWYGMLSFHFDRVVAIQAEDMRHLQGLVDEVAMGIHNFILLKTEAQARREAEEANNLKLKFLAMISHELRTPLTSIKGFSTTLLADDVEWKPENQRDFIETINAEADKLSDLIEQLLDLSRLEAGTIRISPRHVEWDQVLTTSLAQLETLTNNHKLVIGDIPRDFPALDVDVMRVSQVITNLVSNAVKYSPPNTTISISAQKLSDQFIKVSVSDEGMGIPKEAHSRVFEAFQQLEYERRKVQGAGLGLAICRGLIEAHGGRIWVDDHIGTGATISFTLPIAE